MIGDIATVMWKELKELTAWQGNLKSSALAMLFSIGVLGLYLPSLGGRDFFENPYYLLFYIWFPLSMVIGMVMDSFAGERERHTLETLLASRLGDRSIFIGKMSSAVLCGCGVTVVCLLIGQALVNVTSWSGHLQAIPLESLVLGITATLLINTLVSSIGVLISLTSRTVRMANDTLIGAILVTAFVPIAVFYLLPEGWKAQLTNAFFSMGMTDVFMVAIALLIVLDAVAITWAMSMFRRSRLIAL